MKGSCVCICVFRIIPTDRILSTESLCTDIYIHRNYMNNLFFQRAYHIIFIRDLSEVWKLFVKSSYIATRYRHVTCHNRDLFLSFLFSNELILFLTVCLFFHTSWIKIRVLSLRVCFVSKTLIEEEQNGASIKYSKWSRKT